MRIVRRKRKRSSLTIEEQILLLQEKCKEPSVVIGDILELLSEKWQALMILILSLPFCFPIQIPGLSTPFGLVIAFIGLKMAFGKYVWLPEKLLTKTIPSHVLKKIADKALWWIKKSKRWVHPRLMVLCRHPAAEIVNGLLIFVLGIFLALPLPIPLSNVIAASALFAMGIGLLEDDGVFVVISYFISVCLLAFGVTAIFLLKQMFH